MQGALMDLYWDEIPEELKQELLKQVGK
ncbi:hypothetical protein [Porphyromonas loveana]